MVGWISVEDGLPAEDQYIAFARFYSFGVVAEYEAVASGQFWGGQFHLNKDGLEAENADGYACISVEFAPTHWSPLPEPPKLK